MLLFCKDQFICVCVSGYFVPTQLKVNIFVILCLVLFTPLSYFRHLKLLTGSPCQFKHWEIVGNLI